MLQWDEEESDGTVSFSHCSFLLSLLCLLSVNFLLYCPLLFPSLAFLCLGLACAPASKELQCAGFCLSLEGFPLLSPVPADCACSVHPLPSLPWPCLHRGLHSEPAAFLMLAAHPTQPASQQTLCLSLRRVFAWRLAPCRGVISCTVPLLWALSHRLFPALGSSSTCALLSVFHIGFRLALYWLIPHWLPFFYHLPPIGLHRAGNAVLKEVEHYWLPPLALAREAVQILTTSLLVIY